MKTPKLLVLFALTLLVLNSCSTETEEIEIYNQVSEKINCSSLNCFENEVLNAVNDYRVSLGLIQLKTNDLASIEAETHTEYMIDAGKVSHDNFVERQKKLVENANAIKVGENVAFGYLTANEVLEAWLSSSSHKALIENPYYTHFGISIEASNTGKNYFTQIFIKR
ncbi:CAP domain-containing protein [Lutibacter sp. TH_r2]|uniref:CAP domain-containing protein n=1 Tax=Lutibacter sp. TH_r2 TaxID=3082083 RepID=UPI002953FB1E|nr:CAP domain-containing protein [Lutibacter sp. TH_r2]MDV7187583.1 CAP domain-containing protein [Lutibacter sp. TH_r2]